MDITAEELKNVIKEALTEIQPKATLTIDECSEFSGIGRNKLLELVHSKNSDFPVFRVGTKFLINREMLNEWLKKISSEQRQL